MHNVWDSDISIWAGWHPLQSCFQFTFFKLSKLLGNCVACHPAHTLMSLSQTLCILWCILKNYCSYHTSLIKDMHPGSYLAFLKVGVVAHARCTCYSKSHVANFPKERRTKKAIKGRKKHYQSVYDHEEEKVEKADVWSYMSLFVIAVFQVLVCLEWNVMYRPCKGSNFPARNKRCYTEASSLT